VPMTFLRLLNMRGYSDSACPQLYVTAGAELLRRASEYVHLQGIQYTTPATPEGLERLRLLSPQERARRKMYAIDLEVLLFLRKKDIPSTLVRKAIVARYGDGRFDFEVARVDPKFRRVENVISTLVTKASAGFVLEEVKAEHFAYRKEYIEPHGWSIR
jgi:hypothetical protein